MTPVNNEQFSTEQIETILRSVQPQPSAHFYNRMNTAPWVRSSTGKLGIFYQIAPRFLALSFLVILLIIIFSLASPSLGVVAEQILHFFILEPGDILEVKITNPSPESQERYTLSLAEVKSLVNFPIKSLPLFTSAFSFSGARYDIDINAVTLRYTDQSHYLYFTQRPLGSIEEYASIGGSAPTEKVSVRGVVGEYVLGGWIYKSDSDDMPSTITPGSQATLSIFWDSTLPQSILRWEEDGILYELLSRGDEEIGKNDLIKLAESIK